MPLELNIFTILSAFNFTILDVRLNNWACVITRAISFIEWLLQPCQTTEMLCRYTIKHRSIM